MYKNISQEIYNIISSLFKFKKLQLHEPRFDGNELKYINDCIDSTFVSSVGKYVDIFEEKISKYTASKNTIAVINGTSALHSALYLLNIGSEDEVLLPSLNFVASANAIRYLLATPHFIDCEKNTMSMDADKLEEYLSDKTKFNHKKDLINKESGKTIKAIIILHPYGGSADIDKILKVTNKFKLKVIEDAAEGLGTKYKGKHIGTFGDIGILSFNGNKIITCGGGGALLIQDEKLAKKARHITKTSKLAHQWRFNHDQLGFNYRLPNINAALGCAQLENIKTRLHKKRKIHKKYLEAFLDSKYCYIYQHQGFEKPNYWINNLILNDDFSEELEKILNFLNKKEIYVRPIWDLLNSLDYLKEFPSMDLSNSIEWRSKSINLPSSYFLLD